MPEGHTVHRVAVLFRDVFVGHPVEASSPQGRFRDGAELISGQVMNDAWAVGKQLFVSWSGGMVLRVHLGIYGAWSVAGDTSESSIGAPRTRREEGFRRAAEDSFPPEPIGQVRLRLLSDSVVADLRGPTACELLTPDEASDLMATLGPDPLVGKAAKNKARFIERFQASSTPIGVALMNQKMVSGIGNVYRAELLFRHRLDPWKPAKSLTQEQLEDLWDDWTVLLKQGVKTGVMVTRGDLTPAGRRKALRSSSWRHYVYKRTGSPCLACGTPIAMAEMATRKLYYCPRCQDATPPTDG